MNIFQRILHITLFTKSKEIGNLYFCRYSSNLKVVRRTTVALRIMKDNLPSKENHALSETEMDGTSFPKTTIET